MNVTDHSQSEIKTEPGHIRRLASPLDVSDCKSPLRCNGGCVQSVEVKAEDKQEVKAEVNQEAKAEVK